MGSLLDVHDSATTVDKLIEMFTGKIRNNTKTLTWDQGVELAQVDRPSIERGLAVYFCDPHSPRQRPTNENTNGLVRDFLPKGSDFSTLTDKGAQHIQDPLNGRPRKVLNWYTPEEKIQELFKWCIHHLKPPAAGGKTLATLAPQRRHTMRPTQPSAKSLSAAK